MSHKCLQIIAILLVALQISGKSISYDINLDETTVFTLRTVKTHVEQILNYNDDIVKHINISFSGYTQNASTFHLIEDSFLIENIIHKSAQNDDHSEEVPCEITLLSSLNDESAKWFNYLEEYIVAQMCDQTEIIETRKNISKSNPANFTETNAAALSDLEHEFNQTSEKLAEHQNGLNTVADILIKFAKNKFNIEDAMYFDEIVVSDVLKIKNLSVGRLLTLKRDGSIELSRKKNSITITAPLKMVVNAHFKAQAFLYVRFFPTMEDEFAVNSTALHCKITVNLIYDKNECSASINDVSLTFDDLDIRALSPGLGGFITTQFISLIKNQVKGFLTEGVKSNLNELFNANFDCNQYANVVLEL